VSTHGRGYLAVTVAAALWGIAGAVSKYLFASKDVPPFLLVQVRMGFSCLLLALALGIVAPRLLRVERHSIRFFAIWGILGMAAVQFTYLFTISETNVATAIFLQYLSPILTAIYAWLFERQKLGPLLVGCLGLAMAGSFLLIFGGTAQLQVSPLGLASGLASAGFMSFYTIYGAKRVGKLSPWTLLCYGLGTGSLFWLIIDAGLAVAGRPPAGLHLLAQPAMWAFFGYIAIFATIVPFGLYLVGLKWVPPTQATLTGMLEPVVGGVAAYLALGESLRGSQVAGGGLIVAAVVLLQTGQSRSRAKPAAESTESASSEAGA
jgi:drug/metabolite transporter (DMT)-like permease